MCRSMETRTPSAASPGPAAPSEDACGGRGPLTVRPPPGEEAKEGAGPGKCRLWH